MATVIATLNTGSYVGLILSFLVVTVVVVLVSVILTYTTRIADQAEVVADVLLEVKQNTDVLPAVATTNQHALAILQGAKTARGALTG